MDKKKIFQTIYDKGHWSEGGSKPLSGSGSTPEIAKGCIDFIDKHTTDKTVLSCLDLGCGDLSWIPKTAHFRWLNYTGVDIVETIIEDHKKNYCDGRKIFVCKDVLEFTKSIDHYDLVIVRDICFHMSTDDVSLLLRQIQGKYNYLMITSCNNSVNEGEPNGHYYYRPLNLTLPPFNIKGDEIIPEPSFNRQVLIKYGEPTMNKPDRIIWAYWTGEKPSLITILHELMESFSTKGKGYQFNLLTRETCEQYVDELPKCFDKLQPAHQADYVRVSVVCKYGGIWLDSDTLVMESLDNLFDILEYKSGFFITESGPSGYPWNGIFGSNKNTLLMREWLKRARKILDKKRDGGIAWTEIGNDIITRLKMEGYMDDYYLFSGHGDLYPINYDRAVLYITESYNQAMKYRRPFQPLIVLVNEVYRKLADKTPDQIRESKMCLNWFLDRAYRNIMKSP